MPLSPLSARRCPVIDWVTFTAPLESFPADYWPLLLSQNDRVFRVQSDGCVVYETVAWDSIRSDSHSITARVTNSSVWIQGSPARVIGDSDNVFSSGASAAEDVAGCVDRMQGFFLGRLGVPVLPVHAWDVTRIDVTRNLLLDSLAEVRQSLAYLRNAEGGRLRIKQTAGDTIYWNSTSRYKKGKAYAKGPHLLYQMSQKAYHGRPYDQGEIELASRLLRLELTLFKRQWEKNLKISDWKCLTPQVLDVAWQDYFGQLLGHTIMNDQELKTRIFAAAPTPGQGKAAYLCWYTIKSMGWEMARDAMTVPTWYRNLKILKDAGLKVTDLGNGKIIPFRVQKVVTGREVRSWVQLRKAA